MEGYQKIFNMVIPFLIDGLWITFKISIVSLVLGTLLGIVLGILRSLHNKPLSLLIGGYLHLFRGTPFLVQLYIIYYIFPAMDIELLKFDSFTAGFVALSFYASSYVTEIVTAAIQAVPHGQEEAARSCGMSKFQAMYYVMVPQAVKFTIPPMSGVYVQMIKSTAILAVIGITELTHQGEFAILRHPAYTFFILCLVAVLYFIYCYPVLKFTHWAEKKFK